MLYIEDLDLFMERECVQGLLRLQWIEVLSRPAPLLQCLRIGFNTHDDFHELSSSLRWFNSSAPQLTSVHFTTVAFYVPAFASIRRITFYLDQCNTSVADLQTILHDFPLLEYLALIDQLRDEAGIAELVTVPANLQTMLLKERGDTNLLDGVQCNGLDTIIVQFHYCNPISFPRITFRTADRLLSPPATSLHIHCLSSKFADVQILNICGQIRRFVNLPLAEVLQWHQLFAQIIEASLTNIDVLRGLQPLQLPEMPKVSRLSFQFGSLYSMQTYPSGLSLHCPTLERLQLVYPARTEGTLHAEHILSFLKSTMYVAPDIWELVVANTNVANDGQVLLEAALPRVTIGVCLEPKILPHIDVYA
ncbi:hypothetical protein EXIGLDRAFT_775967 [Exidia glandulosa HHB12029]|uniref:F-box domain-containing protein n=1 Tax=Exidia glandulosa HHB12029 TaxID=1314781 RepID=A0A165DNE3_EXIGL|nr:hypothetical protein EXIGLDRAFT_775967 [Exidia glandulosa HHB12029]